MGWTFRSGQGLFSVEQLGSTAEPYLVLLQHGNPGVANVASRATTLLARAGINQPPEHVWGQLEGFLLHLTSQQAEQLRGLQGIALVEADGVAQTSATTYSDAPASTGETLPWGVKAVWGGQDIASKGDAGTSGYAFVIDTGIQSLSDLNVNSTLSRSYVGGNPLVDGHGHGTHVAGIIAAKANGNGVVGVAPGATVVALQALDSTGSGAWSGIISAVDYAAQVIRDQQLTNAVVNMSLSGSASSLVDEAVLRAANAGVRFTLAAGNRGSDADNYSPARTGTHANVFTVSAADSTSSLWSSSNWDQRTSTDLDDCVDLAAPGVGVLSLANSGGTKVMTGTSMAAPHVAGLLLMGGVLQGALITPTGSADADPFALGDGSRWFSTSPTNGSGTPLPPSSGPFLAQRDVRTLGTMTGSFMDTRAAADGLSQVLTETLTGSNRNRTSRLEHIWDFDAITGVTQLHVKASTAASSSLDKFRLSYSTDQGSTWTSLGTDLSLSNNAIDQRWALPLPAGSTSFAASDLWLRVTDTNSSKGETIQDTIALDYLAFA